MANTEILEKILGNDLCAKWINLRDYALDTLSANPDIKAIMDTSDKKLEGQVPVMTSNTAPYGEISHNGNLLSGPGYASEWYIPFSKTWMDDTISTTITSLEQSQASIGFAIGYHFPKPVCIKKAKASLTTGTANETWETALVASNDETNWIELTSVEESFTTANVFHHIEYNTDNNDEYSYYRIVIKSTNGAGRLWFNWIQFYAYEPYTYRAEVPVMTSNTTPYGTVFASAEPSSTRPAWKAFDGIASTNTNDDEWFCSTTTGAYIGYHFTEPVCIKRFKLQNRGLISYPRAIKNFKVQGSNDGSTWTDIQSFMNPNSAAGLFYEDDITNNDYYSYYRVYVIDCYESECSIGLLQFYSRTPRTKYGYGEWALVGQVPKMTSNTAPYGVASANSEQSQAAPAYYAFNGGHDPAYRWVTGTSMGGACWLQYKFTQPIKPSYLDISFLKDTASTFKVQGSNNDGTSWDDLTDSITVGTAAQSTIEQEGDVNHIKLNVTEAYTILRIAISSQTSPRGYGGQIVYAQFLTYQPKGNVPIMTSNTAPYGEAIGTGEYWGNTYNYSAFTGSDINGKELMWVSGGSANNTIFGYKFINPICVRRAVLKYLGNPPVNSSYTVNVQASNDGITWDTVHTEQLVISSSLGSTTHILSMDIDNDDYYLYYRINIPEVTQVVNSWSVWFGLQFYGREMTVSVPTMTSNTAPYGECIASHEYSNHLIFTAFDGNETSGWLGEASVANQYVGYKFIKPEKVESFRLYIQKTGSNTFSDVHAVFEASIDGTTWETISTHSLGNITTAQSYAFYFNTDNESPYLYFRIRFPEITHISGVGGIAVNTLQFFGFDYSERDWDTDHPMKYIYDHGVELEPIDSNVTSIGGDLQCVMGSSAWGTDLPGTKTSDHLEISTKYSTPYRTSSFSTTSKVDLTGYSMLFMRTRIFRSGFTHYAQSMLVGDYRSPYYYYAPNTRYKAMAQNDGRNNVVLKPVLSLNISSINEEEYIVVYSEVPETSGLTCYGDTDEWWLE